MLSGVGWIGSPADVATFVLVLALWARHRARVQTIAASVVALAQRERHVDDDRFQDELDVDDRAVDALRPTIVDGGDRQ